jgi:type II secretory pathway pseudopilin PulG
MKIERGFSVIESLASLLVMAIICSTLASALLTQAGLNKNSQRIGSAVLVAQRILDEYRSRPFTAIPASGSVALDPVTIDSLSYNPTVTFCETPSICSSGSIRQISLSIAHKGKELYAVSTVFSEFD